MYKFNKSNKGNLKISSLYTLSTVILIATQSFYATPARALTVQFGTTSGNTFTPYNNNSSFIIRDNGIGDIDTTTTNPLTLEFKDLSIKNPNSNLDLLFNGVVTANVSFSRTGALNNLSLKLSQFNVTNKATTRLASPISIRFEHAFGLNFTGNKIDLSGFPLFDGTFYANTNVGTLDPQTSATYRTFFLSGNNNTPSTTSYLATSPVLTATTDPITASTNTFSNYQQSFKIDLASQLSTIQISNGQLLVGEVTLNSLGASETLSLPNSACMAIINKPLSSFKIGGNDDDREHDNNGNAQGGDNVSQGQGDAQNDQNGNDQDQSEVYVNSNLYDYREAEAVCHPESVPESSSPIGIIGSAILGAGFLVNYRTKKRVIGNR